MFLFYGSYGFVVLRAFMVLVVCVVVFLGSYGFGVLSVFMILMVLVCLGRLLLYVCFWFSGA